MTNTAAAYEFRNDHPDFQEANEHVHSFCIKIREERQAIKMCFAKLGMLEQMDDVMNEHMFAHDETDKELDRKLIDITGHDREIWMNKFDMGRDLLRDMQVLTARIVVKHDDNVRKLQRQQKSARIKADAIGERLLQEFKDAQQTKEKQKV